LQNPELVDYAIFAKFPKKTKFPEKFKLPDQRGFELTEKRKQVLPPGQPSFII